MRDPKRGMRFEHPRFLAEVRGAPVGGWPAQVCRVTSIRRGQVYFRAADEPGPSTHSMTLGAWVRNVRVVL